MKSFLACRLGDAAADFGAAETLFNLESEIKNIITHTASHLEMKPVFVIGLKSRNHIRGVKEKLRA